MEAAHSFSEPTPLYVAHRNPAPTAAKMNIYDLMSRFWLLNDERTFSGNETRLYFYLLNQFNSARWAAKIYRTTTQIAADLRADHKTIDAARRALEDRGLVHYVAGNKSLSATWALLIDGKNSPQSTAHRVEMGGKNTRLSLPNEADRVEMDGKNSRPYKEEEKIVVEEEDKDTPLPPEKKMGAGVSENSSSPLQAKAELVPPVARPPQEFSDGPQHSAAALALATDIAKLWFITEQSHQPRWARIVGFVHRTEQGGQLAYLTAQFRAYRQIREVRGLDPHKLDDYLGRFWDECDWVAKAKALKPAAGGATTAPSRLNSSLTQRQQQQAQKEHL